MKNKILLFFLMIFLLAAVFVSYNYTISSEQSLKAKRQLLTSQGKPKSEIDATIAVLKSQYKNTFLKDILILFFGVFIGAFPTSLLYLQQKANQKKEKEINILSDTLYYIFKSNNSVNNLLTDKGLLDKCKKDWPDKIPQAENRMYLNFDNEIQKDFFPNLMLHSFHLKRLSDQSFWKDFENLMTIQEKYSRMIMGQKEEKEYSELGQQYKTTMKKFVEKCISKAKINL